MPSPRTAATLAAILFLTAWGAGCAHFASAEIRAASFKPYAEIRMGDNTMRTYLPDRSAEVLAGDHVSILDTDPARVRFRFNGVIYWGMAVAVDTRGYFITANHCISRGKPILVWHTANGKVETVVPRVVWRGSRSIDLAVLSVDHEIADCFQWGDIPAPSDRTLGCGTNRGAKGDYNLQFTGLAGKVLRVKTHSADVESAEIVDDAPNEPGDSGGPVCSMDGRLLGIVISMDGGFRLGSVIVRMPFTTMKTNVLRPDIRRIESIIEADFRQRREPVGSGAARTPEPSANPSTGNPPSPNADHR